MDLSAAVADLAAADHAAGRTAALVVGNVALVAINLENPDAHPGTRDELRETRPGDRDAGTHTDSQGRTGAPDMGGKRVGVGGAAYPFAGREGGGNAMQPQIPGGSPNSVGPGGSELSPQSGVAAGGAPMGTSQEVVENRIATAIQERFPFIAEVRFARTAEQAHRLAALAEEARRGDPLTDRLAELAQLAQEMVAAANLRPMPDGPPGSGHGANVDIPGPGGGR